MTASSPSLEDTLLRIAEILGKLKKQNLLLDVVLEERVKNIESQIHELLSTQVDGDKTSELRLILRSLELVYRRVSHPQYQQFIAEISRLTKLNSPEVPHLMAFLQIKPLKDRDTILVDYCDQLLADLMQPQVSYEKRSKYSHAKLGYCTGYRPEDVILTEYILHRQRDLKRIRQYFLPQSEHNNLKDKIFCRELLVIQRDITEVLACVRSSDSIKIYKVIDSYLKRGKKFQAELIMDAFYATPLKERSHLLTGPSLVKNALAINRDGSLFVDQFGNIDFLRAPSAYRELTGQILHEIKQQNVLAGDENLYQTDLQIYHKIHPDSIKSVTPTESGARDTHLAMVKQGLFKPIVEEPETETTMVELIRRSHDSSGDMQEDDLDPAPHTADVRPKK